MISFSDTTASIRKDTEVWVSGEHILLEVFTPGDYGGFGCRHVSFFEYLYQKLKTELYSKHSNQFKMQDNNLVTNLKLQ